MAKPGSLFSRLMLGFSLAILLVALLGFVYVALEARATQRSRTASENTAHAREMLLHLQALGGDPERIRAAAAALEQVRVEMFRQLDYRSQVRVRVWLHEALVYNSQPQLPERLPLPESEAPREGNAWVQTLERDAASGLVVERAHEVDDRWMLTYSGVSFLMRSTIFSLPLLLLPAWLIVGIGLRPLRSIAQLIEGRSEQDLTPLPESTYRELSPLVSAINQLMARLRRRIENEHEFLTDAAHELKTPLAAIQINAHLLQTRSAESDPQRFAEVSNGLRAGVARANHLVHQLLALERARGEPAALDRAELSLETLVRDRLALLAPMALQRGVEIDFQADAPCRLPLHQESVCALIDNLVGNAIKYSPDQGRVGVRLAALPEGGCRLDISDQGPGIAEALRQRVFERFYRLPGQDQPGSGLGLAIAERAAARNDARITVEAGPEGLGTVFSVCFALSPDRTAARPS